MSRKELMSDSEIIELCRIFSKLGFDKIRLTGGEPTLRKGIVELVREIARISGISYITMTSNGVLLSKLAEPLAKAGLHRVNISLDTINVSKFYELTGRNYYPQVIAGIHAAERAGLLPIKINMVVMRGYNEDEICELAKLTLKQPWQVRFIEMMPLGDNVEFQINQFVSAAEIRNQLENEFGKLIVLNRGKRDGEALIYQISGATGTIGVISSITENFCEDCNRVRLTADGKLRLCLLRDLEVDILSPMRAGIDRETLRQKIIDAIWIKPWGNALVSGQIPLQRDMRDIGG